jgi:hypothetical protein
VSLTFLGRKEAALGSHSPWVEDKRPLAPAVLGVSSAGNGPPCTYVSSGLSLSLPLSVFVLAHWVGFGLSWVKSWREG